MFKLNSEFKDVVNCMMKMNICAGASTWCNKHINETYGKALDNFLSDKKAEQAWAMWTIYKLPLDTETRKRFIQKITDPMSAFIIYIRVATLTPEEDKLLEAIFKGKLPRAEEELRQGKISKRSLNGGN